MKKPEDYLQGKIKDCKNTNSIFNTEKYVKRDDVIRIIREVMIDSLELANEDEKRDDHALLYC